MTAAPRTIAEALRVGEQQLAGTSATARFDSELILGSVVAMTRSELLRDGARILTLAQQHQWRAQIAERVGGRPIAQILGEWEFYSLPLFVDEHVLVPRPETELLVDWAKEIDCEQPIANVLDVGTGSGCIAIALATELPAARVVAIDICPDALAIARRNVQRHALVSRVHLVAGDLMQPLAATTRFDLIVSNPPYIEPGDPALEENVRRFEPDIALHDRLDGDGLGYYRCVAAAAGHFVPPGGSVLLEVGETQASAVMALFDATQWRTEVRKDLAGIARAVRARRR
ncbi:MAG: peptide chain release factor N(5)-glutamine methyltransferase [Planctomycetota bacterium]